MGYFSIKKQQRKLRQLEIAKLEATLAHEYAQNDDTMVGSEELRAYHYYNALHKIGGFSGR